MFYRFTAIGTDLARDIRGNTIIEFAVIAPVMIGMICGGMELGNTMMARTQLEGAMVEAARVATASLDDTEEERKVAVENTVRTVMASYPLQTGRRVGVDIAVYKTFSTAYPEVYTDLNRNGRYDLGEPYTDRNRNGRWDPAVPLTSSMGGPGDVVAIKVTYPRQMLFGAAGSMWGLSRFLDMTATTVVRNEAVVKTS